MLRGGEKYYAWGCYEGICIKWVNFWVRGRVQAGARKKVR